jgi:hypothetical protein
VKRILLVLLIASSLGRSSAQDYQSGVFALPVYDATLLKSQESTTLILALLRGSGTGDCASEPETYQLDTPRLFKVGDLAKLGDRFIADAAARGFKYTHINTSHQSKPTGEFVFTLFKLTGPRGSVFGHTVEFRGKTRTVAPKVTTFATTTVLTICRAR